MSGASETQLHHTQKSGIAGSVQANIVRPSRYPSNRKPDWRLYLFFRIRNASEWEAYRDLIARLVATEQLSGDDAAESELLHLLSDLLLSQEGSSASEAVARGTEAEDTPGSVKRFRSWLGALTGVRGETWREELMGDLGLEPDAADSVGPKAPQQSDEPVGALLDQLKGLRERMSGGTTHWPKKAPPGSDLQSLLLELMGGIVAVAASPHLPALLDRFEKGDPPGAATRALCGGLPSVLIYLFLRQLAGVQDHEAGQAPIAGPLRSEADQQALRARHSLRDNPVNIGFTMSGLEQLGIDDGTLSSFPDPFRQGMAARAHILGDDGPSSPEHWDGFLGLSSVHGVMSTTFECTRSTDIVREDCLEALDSDCEALRERRSDWGRFLGFFLGAVTNMLGIEILQAELGQSAYDIDPETGSITHPPHMIEHFGFRDGISQPYIDLALPRDEAGDTGRGGGTPASGKSWDPVAPGEFFLSEPDEDGNTHLQPANPDLRNGSTYMVFRKLEQDVAGFRSFLANERPDSARDQEKLAAQFMGRWKNGTPLIYSPSAPLELGQDPDGRLNDFRYLDSDPRGLKCPLGSHVRRSNPRDIGRRNDVRRHRILRRGIPYGGPLLGENRLGDGHKRGMYFIAVNARLDLQFELIQSGWINSGEFLGQAGLSRCPISGSNNGGSDDSFLEAGKGAPVTGLQRFVINKGGDYFFMPGMPALRAMASGNHFPSDPGLQYDGRTMAVKTPELLDPERLKTIAERILTGQDRVVTLQFAHPNGEQKRFTFAALHHDVSTILGLADNHFSVEHYHKLAGLITAGRSMIVAEGTGPTRDRLHKVLERAWHDFTGSPGGTVSDRIRDITRKHVGAAIRRTEKTGRVDLVRDLAVESAYGIIKDLYGLPGPDWVTELAIALQFGKRHVGDIPPDWLAEFSAEQPEDPGLMTFQVWSVILMAALLGNNLEIKDLNTLAYQAGSELSVHLTGLIESAAETTGDTANNTLLDAFIRAAPHFIRNHPRASADAEPIYDTKAEYLADVRAILLEIVGTSLAAIPQTFSQIVGFVFEHNISLPETLALAAGSAGVDERALIGRLIYEIERLNPNLPVMRRMCTSDYEMDALIRDGRVIAPPGKINAGDTVILIVKAANVDPRAFGVTARGFSLKETERPMDKYMLFGATGSGRDCWGRDKVAMVALTELVQTLTRFEGLRPVAGSAGKPRKYFGLNTGLKARFTGIS